MANALIHVYLKGTTTPVSDMFDAETGGNSITTLTTNNQSEGEAWFTTPKFVDLFITANPDANGTAQAYLAGATGTKANFTSFTETVEVLPRPEEIAQLDEAQTFTGANIFTGSIEVPEYSTASTPAASTAGRIIRRTDGVRGLWMDQGSQYFSTSGGVVNVKEFGAKGDGVTDDTAAIQEAIDSSNQAPIRVLLPFIGPTSIYGITAPLILRPGQQLVGAGGHDKAVGTSLKALAGFTGAAMIKSNSWDGGDWAHGLVIKDLAIDCAGVAAAGVAIYQMGEESLIERVHVHNATDSGFLFTGDHAVGTVTACSAWSCTNYGAKLYQHPTLPNNGGIIRFFGFSGDLNGAAHMYCDGAHRLQILGIKSEQHAIGILVAGSGTGGSAATLLVSGTFNYSPGGVDVIKIQGTARPVLTLLGLQASGYTNYINDLVQAKTLPASLMGLLPSLLAWNGSTVISGEVILDSEVTLQGRRPATGVKAALLSYQTTDKVHLKAGRAEGVQIDDEAGNSIAKFRKQLSGGVELSTQLRWDADRTHNIGQDTLRPNNLTMGGYVESEEIADPAAPVANRGRLYFKDNGSGKTELVARFSSGSILPIARQDDLSEATRRALGPWTQDNVAASQTGVVLNLYGDTTRSSRLAVRPGSITGIVVRSNEARTAGTLTVEVTKNGTGVGLTAILDGTNTLFKATTQATGLDTYVAGDEIGVTVTTDAGWLPTTADIQAETETVE